MHGCLLRIYGIETWWVIMGSKSLGIWFEYVDEFILTWIWNWDVINAWELSGMKSNLDNCKYFILNCCSNYLIKIPKRVYHAFVTFVV